MAKVVHFWDKCDMLEELGGNAPIDLRHVVFWQRKLGFFPEVTKEVLVIVVNGLIIFKISVRSLILAFLNIQKFGKSSSLILALLNTQMTGGGGQN